MLVVVQIESTDDNEEVFAVPVTGEGTTDDQGEDSFTQPLRPKVDVLWAVDDSGSMSEEQLCNQLRLIHRQRDLFGYRLPYWCYHDGCESTRLADSYGLHNPF